MVAYSCKIYNYPYQSITIVDQCYTENMIVYDPCNEGWSKPRNRIKSFMKEKAKTISVVSACLNGRKLVLLINGLYKQNTKCTYNVLESLDENENWSTLGFSMQNLKGSLASYSTNICMVDGIKIYESRKREDSADILKLQISDDKGITETEIA
ncbi:MAG: hypothetical protein HUJ51_05710 [Eggerthellaceae bacterium]|nr:hypothetical protein [Eggerthellaceae bacterium]